MYYGESMVFYGAKVPSISGGRRATSTNLAAGTHCPAAATTKVAEGLLRSWSCRCNGPGMYQDHECHPFSLSKL